MTRWAVTATFAAAVVLGGCGDTERPEVELVGAYATVSGGQATFYVLLDGDATRITDGHVTTPAGQVAIVRLHEVEVEDGFATMADSGGIDLREGRNELVPGTSHLMAPGLDPAPEVGDELALTLELEDGGRVSGPVAVVTPDGIPNDLGS